MPIVLFEGPDGSGKTTFAKALTETLSFLKPEYRRSPVKEFGWAPNYQTYLADSAAISDHPPHLIVQDRTPEISESIYGVGFDRKPRGRGYLYETFRWLQQDIFMVFCRNDEHYLMGQHEDVEGNPLRDRDLQLIQLMYDHTYFQLRSAMLFGQPHTFRVMEHSRFNTRDWLHVMWAINRWLQLIYPDRANEIHKSLAFSVDSKFPFPQEETID